MAKWLQPESNGPLPSDTLIQIDNRINPRRVVGWRMVGGYYRNGRRYPGFTHLLLDGGGYRYFPENIAIGPALDEADRLGYITTEARAKLEAWVKTGNGVSFHVSR